MNRMKPTQSNHSMLENQRTLNLNKILSDIDNIECESTDSLKQFYEAYGSYFYNVVYAISYDQNPSLILGALNKFEICTRTLKN